VNAILWNDISTISEIAGNIDIRYSDINGDTIWVGEGNINAEPLFFISGNVEYQLQEGSPCINSGTADINSDGFDYSGTAPDMGYYESPY